jgi:tetratricopeptide (TPR) repeat protein
MMGQKMETLTPEQEEEINLLKIACWSNLAACYLKTDKEDRFEKAITNCKKVLELDPTHTKAMYRLGCSYMGLNDLDRSKEYFMQVYAMFVLYASLFVFRGALVLIPSHIKTDPWESITSMV